MKIDMSPKAIENRLKLVGELTKACLLLGRSKSKNSKARFPAKEQSVNGKAAK